MNHAKESSARQPRPLDALTKLVLVHFGTLLVFTSWAYGGQAPWARQVIAVWGGAGLLLFLFVWLRPARDEHPNRPHVLRYLWPLLLYDLVVGVSGFNPSFKEVLIAGEPSLVMTDPLPWLPSAARPLLAWRELWLFNVIVLSCFNLHLVIRERRLLRGVLFLIGGNAVALAVFGTFQKLIGASGLWFGTVTSPNPRFFATFIYHNHWGAFTVLNTAACLGLLFHYDRRSGHRDPWHSPVLLGAVVTLLLATSIPLSASRSSTVLTAILLAVALGHFLLRLIQERRAQNLSAAGPVASLLLATVLAIAAIGYVGREVIVQRAELTTEQFALLQHQGTLTSRLVLYRDTWHMAVEKPWFGWGLESYAHVFRIFNTQRAVEIWFGTPFYAKAHNDWLQSLAEVGFVGTGLLVLLGLIPLLSVPWRRVSSILPRYLLGGCALVLLYACLEFPFANPAVLLTFCASFYCALRYAALEFAPRTHE